ncbi:UNVERIFIED_CONTAM: hypothetical protein RMT77_003302 [Armadillidium vulgare]
MKNYYLVNVVFTLYSYVSAEAKVTNISITNCTCGHENLVQGRIYGGMKAKEEEFPWQVGFIYKNKLFCGGSIINEKYVLTAAHCFKTYDHEESRFVHKPPNRVRIIVGSSKIIIGFVGKGKRILPDIRIPLLVRFHPRYDPYNGFADICLVRIHHTFKEYSPKVLPICLPFYGYSYVNSISIVTGWGKLYDSAFSTQKELRKAEIMVLHPLICEIKYPWLFQRESMICAAYPGRDTCAGDSGGPLITRLNKNQFMQIGITSLGSRCGDSSMPGIYTKVDEFVPWIMKRTKDATYCNI